MEKYVIKQETERFPDLEIDSEKLKYSELTHSLSKQKDGGLVCMNKGNSEEIIKKCKKILKLVREVDQLNVRPQINHKVEMSKEEKVEMYMKLTKGELIDMLIESNSLLDLATKDLKTPYLRTII